MFNGERTLAEVLGQWQECQLPTTAFESSACWALRTGHPHLVVAGDTTARCTHAEGVNHTYLCIPILAQGEALVSGTVADKDCAAALLAAEAEARRAKRGTWADSAAIKNAESPGDILAGIGRFTVVEGRVLSVRQAGATTYLNFGRSWTRGFAATISRRMVAAFEAATGTGVKSFENRRIRVRGFVEARGGPRIELLRVGQVELLGGN